MISTLSPSIHLSISLSHISAVHLNIFYINSDDFSFYWVFKMDEVWFSFLILWFNMFFFLSFSFVGNFRSIRMSFHISIHINITLNLHWWHFHDKSYPEIWRNTLQVPSASFPFPTFNLNLCSIDMITHFHRRARGTSLSWSWRNA